MTSVIKVGLIVPRHGNVTDICLKVLSTLRYEFENCVFTLKTRQMLSVHTTLEKFKHVTIAGQFGFVFEENWAREIT